MAEHTALQLLQNGYIFALIERYNFVKKACNNNFESEWSRDFIIVFMFLWGFFFYFLFFNYFLSKAFQN